MKNPILLAIILLATLYSKTSKEPVSNHPVKIRSMALFQSLNARP